MSISFFPDIEPSRVKAECPFCEGTGKEYGEGCWNCRSSGRYMALQWPAHANFANMNACAVLEALGVPFDHAGCVSHADLPNLLQRALVILNDDRAAAQHTRPAQSGLNTQVFGLDEEGLRERVRSVVAVIEVAQGLGVGIYWG